MRARLTLGLAGLFTVLGFSLPNSVEAFPFFACSALCVFVTLLVAGIGLLERKSAD